MPPKREEPESPYEIVWWFGGVMFVLIVLWWVMGGPEKADLRGIFLAPPPPLGPGDAYGPQVGEPNPNINQQ